MEGEKKEEPNEETQSATTADETLPPEEPGEPSLPPEEPAEPSLPPEEPAEPPPPEEPGGPLPPPEGPEGPSPPPEAPSKASSLEPVVKAVSVAETPSPPRSPSSAVGMKSSSAVKTSESKTPTPEKSVIPGLSASGSLKTSLKSIDELGGNQVFEKAGSGKVSIRTPVDGGGAGASGFPSLSARNFSCSAFLHKRSPFIHNPPQPEERRARVQHPRTPKEYIINLREDLADFQESHGLPRTRDYSFLSLGLALAQETARTVCSLFLMFAELFPILAIVSLILRFALDKLIEILETPEPVPKLKKSVIFGLQMLVIVIPLWILIGTIIIPLVSLVFSILRRMFRLKGGKKKVTAKPCQKVTASHKDKGKCFSSILF